MTDTKKITAKMIFSEIEDRAAELIEGWDLTPDQYNHAVDIFNAAVYARRGDQHERSWSQIV